MSTDVYLDAAPTSVGLDRDGDTIRIGHAALAYVDRPLPHLLDALRLIVEVRPRIDEATALLIGDLIDRHRRMLNELRAERPEYIAVAYAGLVVATDDGTDVTIALGTDVAAWLHEEHLGHAWRVRVD